MLNLRGSGYWHLESGGHVAKHPIVRCTAPHIKELPVQNVKNAEVLKSWSKLSSQARFLVKFWSSKDMVVVIV